MNSNSNKHKKPKDRWLDHWLIAQGEPLKRLVSTHALKVANTEKRKRKRSLKHQAAFDRAIEVLVVNLAYLVVRPSNTGCLALIQDDAHGLTRYEHPSLTISTIRKALRLLKGDVLTVRGGRCGIRTSTIRPTEAFIGEVERCGIEPSDFGRDLDEEVVILGITYRYIVRRDEAPIKRRHQVNYKTDDACVAHDRAWVRSLNGLLNSSDLAFIDDGLAPKVCTEDRTMCRIFTTMDALDIRWDLNGRLFGGYWQNLRKDRRQHLRINGEPISDLDYKNAFARLAYIHMDQKPPEGDLYDLTGILAGYDMEHPTHRDGVKAGFNALLNSGAADVPEILQDLPEGTTAEALRKALAIKHPGLVGAFRTNLGLKLMFTESTILMNALDKLMAQGIVALGMHDGVMVAESNQEAARKAMEAASEEVLGIALVVVSKAPLGLLGHRGVLLAA
ncbi:hypothetical protein [Methylobacterium sp. Leaf99]|uniref:hypothetical protein n=1 Tax=Methylobacterium sp. Leaf99 TaxID=1736251 RepID=UPI000A92C1DF|nr:hypothetical protein [Methylobacterium sp. Leaf99]